MTVVVRVDKDGTKSHGTLAAVAAQWRSAVASGDVARLSHMLGVRLFLLQYSASIISIVATTLSPPAFVKVI